MESTTLHDNSNSDDVTVLLTDSNADTVSTPVLKAGNTDSVPLPVLAMDSTSVQEPLLTETSTPAKGPTLADVLRSQEKLCKDKEKAKTAFRVELPKPSAANLREIENLFAEGHPSWEVSSEKLYSARPY